MSSPTNTIHSDICTSTYPLTRCHGREDPFSPTHTKSNMTEEDDEDAEDISSLALHAIDSLVVERRKRTGMHLCSRQSELEQRCNEIVEDEEEEEDVDMEELGTLALRTVNSIELIRQDSDRLKMGSARSRMSKRERVRSWFFGVWYRA